jgi:deoxyadenosine/deoxycytidine kinase
LFHLLKNETNNLHFKTKEMELSKLENNGYSIKTLDETDPSNTVLINVHRLKGSMIVIEGTISAGKSILAKAIVTYLKKHNINAVYFDEYVNNLLLSQFINNQAKYAYVFQLFMLNKRIETYHLAVALMNQGGCAVIDRSLLGDKVFAQLQHAQGNISDEEMLVYNSIAETEARLKLSNIIYLDVTVETSLRRIMKRSRESEKAYSPQYLSKILASYEEALDGVEYIRLDWNKERVIDDNVVVEVLSKI